MLSRYILDCRRYHTQFAATTWRDCDLRRWLHDEFYDAVFSAAEKRVVNTAHNTDNGEGSPDTDDKVFLLGVAAVHRATQELGSDFRRTRGTEFAKVEKADGCHLYVMDKHVDADYITEGGTRYGCSWWWLRDQGRLKEKGNDPSRAAFVGTRASIRYYARVDLNRDGVRPAMRIDLSKGVRAVGLPAALGCLTPVTRTVHASDMSIDVHPVYVVCRLVGHDRRDDC